MNQILPFRIVAYVLCCERAEWDNPSIGRPKLFEHPVHQAARVSLTAMLRQGTHVRDDDMVVANAIVGNAHELAFTEELEAATLEVLDHGELG